MTKWGIDEGHFHFTRSTDMISWDSWQFRTFSWLRFMCFKVNFNDSIQLDRESCVDRKLHKEYDHHELSEVVTIELMLGVSGIFVSRTTFERSSGPRRTIFEYFQIILNNSVLNRFKKNLGKSFEDKEIAQSFEKRIKINHLRRTEQQMNIENEGAPMPIYSNSKAFIDLSFSMFIYCIFHL